MSDRVLLDDLTLLAWPAPTDEDRHSLMFMGHIAGVRVVGNPDADYYFAVVRLTRKPWLLKAETPKDTP